MSRPIAIITTGLALVFLPSCGSTTYKITLKDGREFLAEGEPEYQAKTGYYRYRTFQDRDALLRADEVLLIEEGD
ncbi:MAG: YgdI/YgdR family lipoprotein [Verrucomicrobiales bacterium]|nr:YgdI/YgdR family lipoprotein [Verrucomicrobiales bacterium]MCP5559954.1 YgdI/YgdR family lipoprotein [Verrucomicrobiaceae bacterium]